MVIVAVVEGVEWGQKLEERVENKKEKKREKLIKENHPLSGKLVIEEIKKYARILLYYIKTKMRMRMNE